MIDIEGFIVQAETFTVVGFWECDGLSGDEGTARFDVGLDTDWIDLGGACKVHSDEFVSDQVLSAGQPRTRTSLGCRVLAQERPLRES